MCQFYHGLGEREGYPIILRINCLCFETNRRLRILNTNSRSAFIPPHTDLYIYELDHKPHGF